MKRDKKRVSENLTVIMGSGVGHFSKCDDVTEDEVSQAWDIFVRQYPAN